MARNLEYRLILDAAGFKRGADQAADSAKRLGSSIDQTSSRAGKLADAIGRTSTTLARSASVFGLPAGALRALDDAADVAELGLNNLSKAAAGFNAASVGVAGAGLAIGTAIGSWLNTFPAVQRAADSLFHSMFRFVGLAGQIDKGALTGVKEFSAQMAASNAEAIKKQVEAQKALGVPISKIAEMYKGSITPELAKQLGLTQEQVKAAEKLAIASKKAAEEKAKFAAKIKAGISDRMIEEMAALVTMDDLLKVAPGAKKGGTAASMVDQFTNSRLKDETLTGILAAEAEAEKAAAEAKDRAVQKTHDLIGTLGTLSNQLSALAASVGGFGGKLLSVAAALSSGAGGIVSGISGFKASKAIGGVTGLLGQISSVGGIVGSAIGIGKAIVGLFKGDPVKKASKEAGKAIGMTVSKEMAQTFLDESKRTGKSVAAVAKEWMAAQKKELRTQGMSQMGQGVNTLLNLLGTSEDITRIAAGNFATLFWETVKDEGWVAASAAFKDQFAKLKDFFGENLPPALQGIQGLMALAENEQVSPYLQAAQAQGQFVTGAMNAGVYGSSMQGDSAVIARQTIGQLRANGATDEQAYQAIGSLLQANVNAAIASGRGISADLQALLDEARANGVDIVADIGVQQLEVLKAIYSQLGGMGGFSGSGGGPFGIGDTVRDHTGGGGGETYAPEGYQPDRRYRDDMNIPQFAEGGIVTKPTVGLVGEAGPEAIIPLNRMGGGITVNATFHGDPTQTHQGRKDLSQFQYQRLLRDLRNDPLVRRYGQPGGSRNLR